MDIFTIPTPPFNAKIRIQKKLLGNYAILREFENRDFGSTFQLFRAFYCNLSLFIEIDGLFEQKRRVVLGKTTRRSFYFKGHFSN